MRYTELAIICAISVFVLAVATPQMVYSQSAALGCGLLPSSLASVISQSAPWYCPINQQISKTWESYLPIAAISVLIAVSVAAVIFAVGAALKNATIRNFGIGEMYEAIATGLIVGGFLYVCAVMFGLIPSLFVGTLNPYATALHLISSTIQYAENLYNALFRAYLYGSMLSTVQIGFGTPGGVSTGAAVGNLLNSIFHASLIAYTVLFLTPASEIAQLLMDGILALYAEYYLIVFFAVSAIPAFIVPGVLFRAFVPTRALGGMLIAIGMAFYIIVPVMFSVVYYFSAPTILQQFNSAQVQIQQFSSNGAAVQNGASQNSPLVTQLRSLSSAIAPFWLLVFFYPIVIIAVAYTFIVQMSSFIGGAAQMSSRLGGFI